MEGALNNRAGPSAATPGLAEKAYEKLSEQIISLGLQPGEVLSEKDLVASTGIGRTPVREAVQRLSAEGLIQVLPRKGLMVTLPRRSDLHSVLEVRRVLERLLVVKSTERASVDQRQALRVLATQTSQVAGGWHGFSLHSRDLDELLGNASHNPFLVRSLSATQGQCRRLWYLFRDQLDLAHVIQLHSGLALAVAEGNGAGAIRGRDAIIAILDGSVRQLDAIY